MIDSLAKQTITTHLKQLESSRQVLHDYIISKLVKRDYHAVQDAASDLREIEVEIRIFQSQLSDGNILEANNPQNV